LAPRNSIPSPIPSSSHETGPTRGIDRLVEKAARAFDVRHGERRMVLVAFMVLLSTITAHTMLETARDALLLAKLPRSSLGVVYIIIAILTIPTGAISAKLGNRFGARRSLTASLVVASFSVLGVHTLPATPKTAIVLYVLTGLIGAVLVPQFWAFTGDLFTVAQGRRLLGPIASAGVIGGLVGSGLAALAVQIFPTRHLLLLASAIFFVAGVALSFYRPMAELGLGPRRVTTISREAMAAIRRDPFIRRIAGLVALSTSTVLAVDYLFKWSVAETVPAQELGRYLATYYAALNGISLVMQLFVGAALVRRLGVAAAAVVTPFLLSMAGLGMVLFGGSPRSVLVTKGVDGALRHSVNRITTELVYLPVPIETRARVKPLIDGALARVAQALTACVLLGLAEAGQLTRGRMIGLVLFLAMSWVALAANTRGPYLEVFRKALARDPGVDLGSQSLDFATVELLVERLASPVPDEVVATIRVLVRRGREKLVPAILLYHPSPVVLVFTLDHFAASDRTDWIPLAEALVSHADEGVRMAALRALSSRGKVDLLAKIADREGPRMRGYVAVWLASRDADPEAKQRLEALMDQATGPEGTVLREGMLAAIAEAPRDRALGELVMRLVDADEPRRAISPENLAPGAPADLLAKAIAQQGDARLVPLLIERLSTRVGREEVRDALVKIGEPAFEALVRALRDPTSPRPRRVHLPRTLARFGTARAAEVLLVTIEEERDGLVRYKAIRGLGKLVTESRLKVDRGRVSALAERNLLEYLRLLTLLVGLRNGFDPDLAKDPRRAIATERFLSGLLEDKMRQALERAFRLMKIAHPTEDIHAVHGAALSKDKRASANAGEFLDTLLIRRSERRLRSILRLVIDDMDMAECAARATALLEQNLPANHADAVVKLAADRDTFLSGIACEHARSYGDADLVRAANAAKDGRLDELRESGMVTFRFASEAPNG
jgi:AAA family ATP:ADP antiporter